MRPPGGPWWSQSRQFCPEQITLLNLIQRDGGLGLLLRWYGAWLACLTPWTWSPTPHTIRASQSVGFTAEEKIDIGNPHNAMWKFLNCVPRCWTFQIILTQEMMTRKGGAGQLIQTETPGPLKNPISEASIALDFILLTVNTWLLNC